MEKRVLTSNNALRLAACILLTWLTAACSSQAEKGAVLNENEPAILAETNNSEEWEVEYGAAHCFPVDQDAFDHPIDEFALPLAPEDNIWPKVQRGLTLEYVDHKAVRQQLNWYVKNPRYLDRVQKRAARYMYHVVEKLHENDMPYDFALLPIIESAYEPFSYSHGQASGLWQFIPMTATRFKLSRNWWHDERRNVDKSTQAAIDYLSYLHGFFDGDWLLAIAAYNAGEGTVRKAVRRNKKKGKPTDFWHLDLPKETTAYVPKLIALTEIFRNPEKYNTPIVKINNQPYYAGIELESQIDLSQAAGLIDISVEELYYLNPGLNRWATPPVKSYVLKVPIDKVDEFNRAISLLPKEQRINWYRHTVQRGDSLISIAKSYNSHTELIKEANQLSKQPYCYR